MRHLGSWTVGLVIAVSVGCAAGTHLDGAATTSGTHGSSSSGTGTGGLGAGGHAAGGEGGKGTGGGAGGQATGGKGTGGQGSGGMGGATSKCGNGVVDLGEQCDGANLAGRSCGTEGFLGGTLGCKPDCTLDTALCGECNDGVIEPMLGEDCDFDSMSNPIVNATCQSLGLGGTGKPGCAANCKYDLTPCQCGDGMVEGSEQCDGADLGGHTCATQGFTAGTVTCDSTCHLVTTGCTKCGNGVLEAGEQCDDGNMMSGDGCSATCQTEATTCDPDGVWTIVGTPFTYSCCLGLVAVNVSSFIFSSDGASIDSSPSDPAVMTGAATTCPSGSFSATATLSGGCAEHYTLTGTFTGPNTWNGTYKLTFTGSQCSCLGLGQPCVNQTFPVSAMR